METGFVTYEDIVSETRLVMSSRPGIISYELNGYQAEMQHKVHWVVYYSIGISNVRMRRPDYFDDDKNEK